jgi:hypothetical protein
MTPHATLWPGKYAPTQVSHSVPARRTPPALSLQFAARQMVAIRWHFFINTTGGLIVMAFNFVNVLVLVLAQTQAPSVQARVRYSYRCRPIVGA